MKTTTKHFYSICNDYSICLDPEGQQYANNQPVKIRRLSHHSFGWVDVYRDAYGDLFGFTSEAATLKGVW